LLGNICDWTADLSSLLPAAAGNAGPALPFLVKTRSPVFDCFVYFLNCHVFYWLTIYLCYFLAISMLCIRNFNVPSPREGQQIAKEQQQI